MSVKRQGKWKTTKRRLEVAQRRGLALGGLLVAQRATGKAHVITGRLKRSITSSQPKKISNGRWAVDIGTNVNYAKEEEFRPGTKDGTPHAFLRPAINESKRDVIRLIVKNIVSILK